MRAQQHSVSKFLEFVKFPRVFLGVFFLFLDHIDSVLHEISMQFEFYVSLFLSIWSRGCSFVSADTGLH